MKRTALALSLILTMLLSVVITIENVKVTSASENWVEVTRYSGEGYGGMARQQFNVSHSEWRVNWRFIKDDGFAHFFVLELHSVNGYKRVGGVSSTESSEPTSGTIVVHSQNRTFYINVQMIYSKSWEVIIEENVNSPLLDVTDPIVSIFSPENKTYYTEDVALTFTVNEPTFSIGYQIDETGWFDAYQNRTFVGLAEGAHSVTVRAKDEAGNFGFSETIYFNVEEPFPTTLIVAVLIIAAVVGASLLFLIRQIKKNRG